MLHLKLSLILPENKAWGVYPRIPKNHNSGQETYGKTIGKSTEQGEDRSFNNENWPRRGAVISKKSIGANWGFEV